MLRNLAFLVEIINYIVSMRLFNLIKMKCQIPIPLTFTKCLACVGSLSKH